MMKIFRFNFSLFSFSAAQREYDLVDYEKPSGVKKHENGMNEIMLLEKIRQDFFSSFSFVSCPRLSLRFSFYDDVTDNVNDENEGFCLPAACWGALASEVECFLRNCFGFACATSCVCCCVFPFLIFNVFSSLTIAPTRERESLSAAWKLWFTLIPFYSLSHSQLYIIFSTI